MHVCFAVAQQRLEEDGGIEGARNSFIILHHHHHYHYIYTERERAGQKHQDSGGKKEKNGF